MDFNREQQHRLFDAWAKSKGDADAILALAALAVELKAESGGTMTAEQVSEALREGWTSDLHQHIATQGATVAMLQAKVAACESTLMDAQTEEAMQEAEAARLRAEVKSLQMILAELEKDGTDARAERDAAREDVSAIRAEAERVKAMVATRNSLLRHKQEALTAAESRLAAILERQAQVEDEKGLVRWVVEGDAPQEAKCDCAVKNIACIHEAARMRRGYEVKDPETCEHNAGFTIRGGFFCCNRCGGPPPVQLFPR